MAGGTIFTVIIIGVFLILPSSCVEGIPDGKGTRKADTEQAAPATEVGEVTAVDSIASMKTVRKREPGRDRR